MPGQASLSAQQYYAHPRNAFWPIMSELLGLAPGTPYTARLQALTAAGLALWDVMQSCEREGSLDSAIRDDSVVPNDVRGFLAAHPQVALLCFNGAKAEQSFRRHILPDLGIPPPRLLRLPSTSPAHAGMPAHAKLAAWRAALADLLSPHG